MRYAAAGHPPPLLVAPNGRARYLEGARGVPLDRALGHVYEDAVAAVPEGTTLVLYSDGAIERRGEPLDVGLERLAEAAAESSRLAPEGLCTRLIDALLTGTRRHDDVALVAARVHAPAIAPLRLWFAARADQLAVVREAMRSWLASAGVDAGDGEVVVLAAGELCANAVEHAYPAGSDAAVEVALARDPGGGLTLVVRDRGRWRPPPADPGSRGRGLSIVRALMHAVDIDEGADGTTVSVRFQPGAGGVAPPRVAPGPVRVEIDRSGVGAGGADHRRDRPRERRPGRAAAAGARAGAGDRRPLRAGVPRQRGAAGAVRARQPLRAAGGRRAAAAPRSGARWRWPSWAASRTSQTV